MNANISVLKVKHKMSEKQLTYCASLGLDVRADPEGKRLNKHAEAAVERLACESAALVHAQKIAGRGAVVLDIFSNAVRMHESIGHLGLEIDLVPVIPVIVPADRHRQRAAEERGIAYHDCQLIDLPATRNIDVLNFTHSLYYVEPTLLIETMIKHGAYHALSTQHCFTQAAAKLCNETVSYYYGTDCNIMCSADGDGHVYQHGAMHWISGPPIKALIGCAEWHLHWYVLEKYGDTFLYHFELRPGMGPAFTAPGPMTVGDTTSHDIHPIGHSLAFSTAINKEMRSPLIDLAFVPVTGAVFYYGLFGVQLGNGEFIAVPRGLVGDLALTAASEKRCPALYALLVARAKQRMRDLNYPTDLAARAAIYAAVSALILHVEFETVALGSALALFRRLFSAHSRVLDFEPVYLIAGRGLAAISAGCLSTLVPMHYYGIDYKLAGLAKAAILLTFSHPFLSIPAIACTSGCAWLWHQRLLAHRSADAETWKSFRSNLMPGPAGRTLLFQSAPTFAASSVVKTQDPIPRPNTRIIVHNTFHQPDVRALARRGLTLHGIGIQESTPSYVAKTTQNALDGLMTRTFNANPRRPNKICWFRIFKKLTSASEGSVLHKFILGELRNLNGGTFKIWASRFPNCTKISLESAEQSLIEEDLNKKDLRVASIVKMEKSGTLTVAGDPPEVDPRIVNSCTHRANAYFGPTMWCMGNVFKKRFDYNAHNFLVWDSGFAAEDLGHLFDFWTEAFTRPGSPCKYIVYDRKRFEKNQEAEAQTYSNLIFRGARCSEEFIKNNDELHRIKGSVQGLPISFQSSDPTMISGGNDTAWRNFAVNAAGVIHSLGEPSSASYGVVIKGDDGIVVTFGDNPITWEEFEESSADLGLPVTGLITIHPHEVEFASNIPYPTATGTVWGPKIGRTLQRFAWTLSNAPPDVYGAATSLYETTNHIPFLRGFIRRHQDLAQAREHTVEYFKYKTKARCAHEASPETYAFVEARYGLTPDMERHFEDLLATCATLPCVISWPLIDTLVDRDA